MGMMKQEQNTSSGPPATLHGPGGPRHQAVGEIPQHASMKAMIDSLWYMRRDLISDGYDAALEALATQLPMTVHEYSTGTECWTWIVPEKWTCREAYLETIDGVRLFSYEDNPLHVMSYSLPFEGEVSREELFHHLHDHPKLPAAVPYMYKFYERDWGLCCSQNQKSALTEDRYRVHIDSEFSRGTLKVGEAIAPGRSEECIVLCAHLDHPAMANDDLSGVVVGVEAMRRLREHPDLRYTYRLLIVPETIGSVAYLSHHEHLIPQMKGGLFLEMLGLENPHALQLSHAGDTGIDRCFSLVLEERCPDGLIGEFLGVIRNDERQFNAPGVRVPMLSLSRVLPPTSPDWPYPEYHSSMDNPHLVSEERLAGSADLVMAMIDAWEANQVPINRFSGEVFLSRYELHMDPMIDPAGYKALFKIMFELDGTKSIADIAEKLLLPFTSVLQVVHAFERRGLIEFADHGAEDQ